MNGKVKYLFILYFSFFLVSCQNKSDGNFIANTSIIPKPQLTQLKEGYLEASEFIIKENSKFVDHIDFFENQFQNYFQKKGKYIKTGIGENLIVNINNEGLQIKGNYKLKVDEEKILIEGDQKGIFYGFQTLFQLILLNNENFKENFKIPCLEIQDSSSFSHRGFLMDCCRHFFSVSSRRVRRASGVAGPPPPPPPSPVHRLTARTRPAPRAARRRRRRRAISPPRRSRA